MAIKKYTVDRVSNSAQILFKCLVNIICLLLRVLIDLMFLNEMVHRRD